MSMKPRLKGRSRSFDDEAVSQQANDFFGSELTDASHGIHPSALSVREARITASATFELAAVATAVSPPLAPRVVQIIDTTKWPKPSPDPAGLTWMPGGGGALLMTDSEIDESPFFRPDNLFYLSARGAFDHSASLQSFCKEATGVAFNPLNGDLFISDDSKKMVFRVDPANPGTLVSSFSTSKFGADDVEDIIFDPVTGHLLLSEGEQGSTRPRTLFEVTASGALVSTLSLPTAVGDPEGLAYDPDRNVFYMSGHTSEDILVVSRTGQIVDRITVLRTFDNPSGTGVKPKGLTLAPTSNPNDDPDNMSLWVADYGKDQFMDGRIFEIELTPSALPPLFTANNDTVNFNQVNAGTYAPGSQYDALGGNDTVTLPTNAAEASAAGFDATRTFNGGNGGDIITGGTLNDRVAGGDGNDLIRGGAGNDMLAGDGNADTLVGGLGNDQLNGGSSNDTLDYSAAAAAVTINLALGTATGEGNDTLLNVEHAIGAAFNDAITGNTLANALTGGAGNDTLRGGSGNDTLTGSAGNDRAFGENGNDTLKWDSADIFDGGTGFDTLDANLSSASTIDMRTTSSANLERIQSGGGNDVVTLSLGDVLSDTADNQFVADLGSGTADTLKIDLSGGWRTTAANSTLGPTGVAAGISVSGMTARTFTNGDETVTIFTNAETVSAQILSS
jgi:Ca2+-binding RTX toxin-like protein